MIEHHLLLGLCVEGVRGDHVQESYSEHAEARVGRGHSDPEEDHREVDRVPDPGVGTTGDERLLWK